MCSPEGSDEEADHKRDCVLRIYDDNSKARLVQRSWVRRLGPDSEPQFSSSSDEEDHAPHPRHSPKKRKQLAGPKEPKIDDSSKRRESAASSPPAEPISGGVGAAKGGATVPMEAHTTTSVGGSSTCGLTARARTWPHGANAAVGAAGAAAQEVVVTEGAVYTLEELVALPVGTLCELLVQDPRNAAASICKVWVRATLVAGETALRKRRRAGEFSGSLKFIGNDINECSWSARELEGTVRRSLHTSQQ
jgi:hypothetical protein